MCSSKKSKLFNLFHVTKISGSVGFRLNYLILAKNNIPNFK